MVAMRMSFQKDKQFTSSDVIQVLPLKKYGKSDLSSEFTHLQPWREMGMRIIRT